MNQQTSNLETGNSSMKTKEFRNDVPHQRKSVEEIVSQSESTSGHCSVKRDHFPPRVGDSQPETLMKTNKNTMES